MPVCDEAVWPHGGTIFPVDHFGFCYFHPFSFLIFSFFSPVFFIARTIYKPPKQVKHGFD